MGKCLDRAWLTENTPHYCHHYYKKLWARDRLASGWQADSRVSTGDGYSRSGLEESQGPAQSSGDLHG